MSLDKIKQCPVKQSLRQTRKASSILVLQVDLVIWIQKAL